MIRVLAVPERSTKNAAVRSKINRPPVIFSILQRFHKDLRFHISSEYFRKGTSHRHALFHEVSWLLQLLSAVLFHAQVHYQESSAYQLSCRTVRQRPRHFYTIRIRLGLLLQQERSQVPAVNPILLFSSERDIHFLQATDPNHF